MEIKKFPVLSTGFGLKLMAENGEIYARVNNEENSDNGNLLVYGTIIDTVLCIKDGKPQMMPIFVLDSQAGDYVKAVLNGVKEHETFVEEGETVVQNAYHGETYKMKLKKLKKLYVYAETTAEGYQLWKPKEEIQMWTFTPENIFGILWGGFEFLAKAMINITDPNDVYGCNYTVFNGDDTANGSHQKLKLFLPANPLPESWLQAPEVLEGQHLTLEAVPKTNYIECPFPLILWQKLA